MPTIEKTLFNRFLEEYNNKTDINEHLPVLHEYAKKCNHVTEMGVRGVVSSYAFILAKPKTMVSIDIKHPKEFGAESRLKEIEDFAKHSKINFRFLLGDTLNIKINKTDLLFIDTLHTYNQMKSELKLHASNVSKYLIFHDTVTYRFIDEITGNKGGIWPAIDEFLKANVNWNIDKVFTNNNGLTILKRNK